MMEDEASSRMSGVRGQGQFQPQFQGGHAGRISNLINLIFTFNNQSLEFTLSLSFGDLKPIITLSL